MTSIVESRAHLEKRMADMGMSDRAKRQLLTSNLDTLGKLAFSIGQPGQPLDQAAFDTYAANTLGAMYNAGDTSILKRLIFEAHTMVLGQLRELVADPNIASSRKLPAVEREHRMQQLRGRLIGVLIEKQMEPSHELLELMMQQKESNQLSYVNIERCSSREWEVTMGKNKKQISIDPQHLTVKEQSSIPDQAHSSELQAFEALRRRGLAMEFADMCSWDVHERYLQDLTSHLRMDAPPGFSRPTLGQVLKADRQVFMHMIRTGVQLKRLPNNELDMDTAILRALQSYEVGFHLLPLPKASAASSTDGAKTADSTYKQSYPNKTNRWEPYKGKGKNQGGKSKGKGKSTGILPKQLLGRDNVSSDPHGRRLCFNYNMGKCDEVPDGGECSKGWHLCCRKGCFSPHAEKDHGKKKWRLDRISALVDAGADISQCMVVEIFAGTGRVTASLKEFGLLSCFGTDHVKHRQAVAPIVLADLTTANGLELLHQWLANPQVVGIFMAPPCGSASRARSIPLKRKRPGNAPRPLRSDACPNGLPGLNFSDRMKISKANRLYSLTAQLVKWAHEVGVLFCIENPQFSHFWATTFMQDVLPFLKFTVFHSCQYGSSRMKRTMLAFNASEFYAINKCCQGVSKIHKHAKWGVDPTSKTFATSLETAYPMPLARSIASQFVLALSNLGIRAAPELLNEVTSLDNVFLPALRAQAGQQPRVSKLPPLIPTFAAKISLTGFHVHLPNLQLYQKVPADILINTVNAPTTLCKGSKLLQLSSAILPSLCLQGGPIVSGQKVSDEESQRLTKAFSSDVDANTVTGETVTQTWGIPWTDLQFVEQAQLFGHPASLHSALPEVMLETINRYATMTAAERIQHRTSCLGHWIRRLKELKTDEAEFKGSLDKDVQVVLKGKNLLVWKEMLKSVGYHDMGVFDELAFGTHLIGEIEPTGIWPKRFQPQTVTEDDLQLIAKKERALLVDRELPAQDSELCEEVWNQTLAEVETGALVGPLEVESIPECCPLSRRFGIKQGNKVRCVDDFTMSSVNSCVQCTESPKPHTADVLAALVSELMAKIDGSDGSWLGRAFDLKGAYRQCAVHPGSMKYAHIFTQEPISRKLWAFRMRALPFGAVRSVHGFLRVSYSLWYLLTHIFFILTTNYFDDYVVVASSHEAQTVTACVQLFFRITGWRFAETGPKAPDFAELFTALGISINVSDMRKNVVRFDNTDNRKAELVQALKKILDEGKLGAKEALRLRGRLQFASGQIFGRVAKAALGAVTNHAYHRKRDVIDSDTRFYLMLHLRFLSDIGPRQVSPCSNDFSFILTDAFFEIRDGNPVAGIGAVLCNSEGKMIRFISQSLDVAFLEQLNPDHRKTIIFECEFFAVYCALWSWCDLLQPALIVYTDNNGVRDSLISCHTSNVVAKQMLIATLVLEMKCNWRPWYARVPTDSNISDSPSRFDTELLTKHGVLQTNVDIHQAWRNVTCAAENWGDGQTVPFAPHWQKDANCIAPSLQRSQSK